jgi:hypothetical protein
MAIEMISKRPRHLHVHITTHTSPPLSKRSPRFLMTNVKGREKCAHWAVGPMSFGFCIEKRSAQDCRVEVPHWGRSENVMDGGLDKHRVEAGYVCFWI